MMMTASPETPITFQSLALMEPIQRALRDRNYDIPSPIQAQAIPHILAGRDLIGCAQTGTGKTAAFTLPLLHRLATDKRAPAPKTVRALVLTPTRELASQIVKNVEAYGAHLGLHHAVIYGGVGQFPQVKRLARGVDVLVATPGRLFDLLQQRHVRLDQTEVVILDEADRMLDMGFINDIRRVVALLPKQRQSLLFSATMPPPIRKLAAEFLNNPVEIQVAAVASTAERIDQKVCYVRGGDKNALLRHFLEKEREGRALIFMRMKHSANRLAGQLEADGFKAAAIHGNKSQAAREKALERFRHGSVRVLVATDVAARGIDVKGITLVVNFDIPDEPESYVHRIGRTARAGASGLAVAFCSSAERGQLREIERLIAQRIPVDEEHPFAKSGGEASPQNESRESNQRSRGGFKPRRSHFGGRHRFAGRGNSR